MNPAIQAYIKSFADPKVQLKLSQLYQLLLSLIPAEAERQISYGIPTFKLKGKNLIHFGGAKNHVAIYPGAAAVEQFSSELQKLNLDSSKGTIKFKLEQDLPAELIQKIVKFKLASS